MNALITAHIGGLPVEEMLPSLLSTGGCVVLAVRMAAQRLSRRSRERGVS